MDKNEIFGEREKSAVSALVEEYKARMTQIFALDLEVHRWSASYLVALVVGIGWALGSDKIKSLSNLFIEDNGGPKYDNCYLILSVATINALYILWMALKGFQTQQIYLYLYSVTGKQISELIERKYNSYEVWRRSQVFCSTKRKGNLDWRRSFFFTAFTVLPFGISFSILWMYGQFVAFSDSVSVNDLFVHRFQIAIYIAVIVFHLVIAGVALSTTKLNMLWVNATRRELEDKSPQGINFYIYQLLNPEPVLDKRNESIATEETILPSEIKKAKSQVSRTLPKEK